MLEYEIKQEVCLNQPETHIIPRGKPMNLLRLSIFVLFFTAVVAEKSVLASQQKADWSTRFGTGYLLSDDADFDNGGNYSSQSFFISGSTRKAIGQNSSLGVGVDYTAIDYDFGGFAVTPWGRADFLTLSVPFSTAIGEEGQFGFIGSLGTASEESADFAEGVTVTTVVSYMHRFAPALSAGLGAGYVYGLEDSTFFPMLLVRWQITDHLLLANPFRPGPFGPAGLELSYRFNEQLDFGLGGVYRSVRFALDDTSPVAPAGFAEFEGFPVFARIGWDATQSISLNGYLGMTLGGQLNIDDSGGHELSEDDYDTQAIIGLNISGRF